MALTPRQVYGGVPYSDAYQPLKSDIINLWDATLFKQTAANAGALVAESKAALDALAPAANSMAWVIGDPDPALDGVYQYSAGTWTRRAALPYGSIHLNNTGAGTGDAIEATTAFGIPEAAYGVIYSLNIEEANTGPVTISINGAAPRPVVSNTGAPLDPGALQPEMGLLALDDGTNLRLFVYGDVQAILVAAEAARDEAQAAAASVSVRIFNDLASAAAATVPAIVKRIRTQFYDPLYAEPTTLVGGAHYKRVATEPTHALKFRSTDRFLPDGTTDATNGGWWTIDEREIWAEMNGAVGDEARLCSAAFQGCIDYLEGIGGGVLNYGKGVFLIEEGLIVDDDNVHLKGQGSTVSTNNSNWRQFAATTFKWAGVDGGTVIKFETPIGRAQKIQNSDISRTLIECNDLANVNHAAFGVDILTLAGGNFRDCNVFRPTSAGWNMDIKAGLTGFTDPTDTQHVAFWNCHVWAIGLGPSGSANGWQMGKDNVATGTGNVSLCQWFGCAAYVFDGYGWDFYGADSNTGFGLRTYVHPSGSGDGVRFNGGSETNKHARGNAIYGLMGNGRAVSANGTIPPENNVVFGNSTENGAPDPLGTDRFPIYHVGDNGAFRLGAGEVWGDDSGAGSVSGLALTRYSSSPAANDSLLSLDFKGFNSAGEKTTYAEMIGVITDPTDGSEDGGCYIRTMSAGALAIRGWWRLGLSVGAGAADPGTGIVNTTGGYRLNNSPVVDGSGGIRNQTTNTTDLGSAAAAVNTTNKAIGKQVWSLDNGHLYVATATGTTGAWKSMLDGTTITPS